MPYDETIHTNATSQNKYHSTCETIVSWVHPLVLCVIGLGCIIPYMLTVDIYVRLIQVVILFCMAMQIKHIRIMYFLMLTCSIVFFYILVPQGKILYEWWFLTITEDALRDGIFRGLTLNGYVFLSLSCISPRLSLPTKYGALLTKSITYFTMMIESASNIEYRTFMKNERRIYKHSAKKDRKKLGERLTKKTDFLLSDLIKKIQDNMHSPQNTPQTSQEQSTRISIQIRLQKTRGIVFIGLLILSTWGGWLISKL